VAIACPNCGTQNADGSQFCQNCRAPLVAAGPPPPAAAPAPGYAPPAFAPPPGYAPGHSAYYAPAGPAAPVHRTPMGLIIGGALAAFLILAIVAVAAGFVVSKAAAHSTTPPSSPPTAAPTAAPTAVPTAAPTTAPTRTPTPAATAAPKPTAAPAAGDITTNTFTLGLVAGWKKIKSDKVSALVANDTGSIYVLAGRQDHQSSVDNEFAGVIAALKAKYPQVSECTKSASFSVDGVDGTIWGFNYLWTAPSGQTVTVCDLYFFSVPASDPTYFYEVELFMADADFDKFANGAADPELATLRWIKP
jgi:zinc-ribbon domain